MLYRALQIHRKFEQPRPQSKPSSLSKVIDAQKAYYKSLAQSFKANTLREIGTTLVSLNRRVEAVDSYRKALKLYQNQNDKSSQALTLVEICKVQRSLKQYQHALESCNQALSILQQFRNLVEEAKTRLEIEQDIIYFFKLVDDGRFARCDGLFFTQLLVNPTLHDLQAASHDDIDEEAAAASYQNGKQDGCVATDEIVERHVQSHRDDGAAKHRQPPPDGIGTLKAREAKRDAYRTAGRGMDQVGG